MKKILYILFFAPTVFFAQQTITSVQNGNASNPLTWDCFCFPTTDDDIIINHIVSMDVDWAITNGGSITVNTGKSLMQTGLRSLLVDGAGSVYVNNGSSSFNDIAYTNSGNGQNSGSFSVTRAMYVGPGSSYTNNGTLDGLDSLLTEGNFSNSGTTYTGNFLNTGTLTNTGNIGADSVGNTGTFNSTGGYMFFNAFGNSGTFTMSGSGFMDVIANWANIGDFTLGAGVEIYAHNDFFNGDSLGGTANLHNNGSISVTNNFLNGFFIDGSGNFCVGNDSYNVGTINGTLDFCDNTGGGIDLNTGTIAGTVTFCQPGCTVGIEDLSNEITTLYPNPTNGEVTIVSNELYTSFCVYSIAGQKLDQREMSGNSFQLNNLEAGTYFIQLNGAKNSALIRLSVN